MKKLTAILFAALMAFALCACGGDTNKTTEGGSAVAGEVYDTGLFSVLVPTGMYAKPQNDMFSDDNELDPSSLHIASTDDEWYFTEPYVIIYYYPSEDSLIDISSFYDNVQDITPFTVDGTEWSGYTAESMGYPLTYMTGMRDGGYFAVTLMAPDDSKKMTTEDATVQAILESIAVTAK